MTTSNKSVQKKSPLVAKSALLDESDYKYISSFEKDWRCPNSTIVRIAVHRLIMMEKNEEVMGRIVIILSKKDDSSTHRVHQKIYLTEKQDEIIEKLSMRLECSYSQIVRYAYHRFAVMMHEWEHFNDKELEELQGTYGNSWDDKGSNNNSYHPGV